MIIQVVSPWVGQFFTKDFILSHAWATCSLSNCLKFIMLLLKDIILAGGYFPMKPSLHFIHESILFLGKESNHSLARPLKEKGKKFQFNNITIYILILLHLTKFNKIIKMGSSSIISTNTRKLLFHNKI